MQRRLTSKLRRFEFGNALVPDGTNDFVSFSNITELNSTTSASVHLWTKIDSISSNMSFGSSNSSVSRFSVSKFSGNDNLFLIISNGANTNANFDFTPFYGQKILISIVYNGLGATNVDKLKLYINAVEKTLTYNNGSVPASTSIISGVDFFIGRYELVNSYSDAPFNELSISNGVSSPSEITDLYNSGNGSLATISLSNVIAYWRCNEDDGATTLKDKLNNYNGTLNNFTTPPAYFVDWNSI